MLEGNRRVLRIRHGERRGRGPAQRPGRHKAPKLSRKACLPGFPSSRERPEFSLNCPGHLHLCHTCALPGPCVSAPRTELTEPSAQAPRGQERGWGHGNPPASGETQLSWLHVCLLQQILPNGEEPRQPCWLVSLQNSKTVKAVSVLDKYWSILGPAGIERTSPG